MRIVQIVNRFPPSTGGAENYVFKISENLQKQGHEVLVLTSDLLRDDTWMRLPSNFAGAGPEGVEVRRFKAHRFFPGHGSGVVIPGVFKALLREHQADIIHANSYGFYSSYAPILAAKITNTPVVFTTLISPSGVMPHVVRLVYDSIVGSFTLKSSDHLIALTSKEKDELLRHQIPRHKITVIPPGVDVEPFLAASDSMAQEFRDRINPEGAIVLYVGRLGQNKGLEKLIASIPLVLNRVPRTKFLIVGEDWGIRGKLEALAHSEGVRESVIFGGRFGQRDLTYAYLASDLFVFPSMSAEAFGLVLLEAMAAGKPIVAFEGMTPEILEENRNCILAVYGDPKSLADAIVNLLLNPTLSRDLADNNRKTAVKYTWESVGQRLTSIYERAAGNNA